MCLRLHSLSPLVPGVLQSAPQDAPIGFLLLWAWHPHLHPQTCTQMWHWALSLALWSRALSWMRQVAGEACLSQGDGSEPMSVRGKPGAW